MPQGVDGGREAQTCRLKAMHMAFVVPLLWFGVGGGHICGGKGLHGIEHGVILARWCLPQHFIFF